MATNVIVIFIASTTLPASASSFLQSRAPTPRARPRQQPFPPTTNSRRRSKRSNRSASSRLWNRRPCVATRSRRALNLRKVKTPKSSSAPCPPPWRNGSREKPHRRIPQDAAFLKTGAENDASMAFPEVVKGPEARAIIVQPGFATPDGAQIFMLGCKAQRKTAQYFCISERMASDNFLRRTKDFMIALEL
jgi:hypothetical protein